MDYEEMIKRAKEQLPEDIAKVERFNIPKVTGSIQGNKTIVNNYFQICKILRRKPEHVLKFILKELATPGDFSGQQLIFGSKVQSARINDKLNLYASKFVICKECGKPDTSLTKEMGFYFIKCQACGAKYSVKYSI